MTKLNKKTERTKSQSNGYSGFIVSTHLHNILDSTRPAISYNTYDGSSDMHINDQEMRRRSIANRSTIYHTDRKPGMIIDSNIDSSRIIATWEHSGRRGYRKFIYIHLHPNIAYIEEVTKPP